MVGFDENYDFIDWLSQSGELNYDYYNAEFYCVHVTCEEQRLASGALHTIYSKKLSTRGLNEDLSPLRMRAKGSAMI